MLDTLTFARRYDAAANDEDRAAVIAAFVTDLVRSNGEGAATRADAVRLTNEVGQLESVVRQALAELKAKSLGEEQIIGEKLDQRFAAMDEKLAQALARVDQKLTAMSSHIETRIDEGVEAQKAGAGGRTFFQIVLALLIVAGTVIAMKSPTVAGLVARLLGTPVAP